MCVFGLQMSETVRESDFEKHSAAETLPKNLCGRIYAKVCKRHLAVLQTLFEPRSKTKRLELPLGVQTIREHPRRRESTFTSDFRVC